LEIMEWRTAYLDALLVPTGLLILLTYQACLVRRVKHKPLGTVIGVNHLARRQWVYSMMKVQYNNSSIYTYVLLLFM
jgi:hypothetical protein